MAATACLVGFAAGRRAEAMSGMSQSSIVLQALDQLDRIFGALLILDPSFLPCMRQAHPRQDDHEPPRPCMRAHLAADCDGCHWG